MKNYFSYSILQYKHSVALGEILNVGILFYFSDTNKFEFASSNGHRIKAVYPDFDLSLFNSYLRAITEKVKKGIDLFTESTFKIEFSKYIHQHILAQDAAGLIFSEPKNVRNTFVSSNDVVDEYSKLLLPGITIDKSSVVRHNEVFILKKYTSYIFETHKELEERFDKNRIIQSRNLTLKFELSWENREVRKLIKPLSFDLTTPQAIQEKASTYLGYLTQLEEFALRNNSTFDFLISKPQNSDLKKEYDNAIDILNYSKTPKNLILENSWDKYFQDTVSVLLAS